MRSTTTSFAAIGHVTNDRLASGIAPGGSALYAALTAARLGCRASILTSFGDDFTGRALLDEAGVTVDNLAAERTTTFENLYEGGVRRARVDAVARRLEHPARADVVFACPVVDEVAPEIVTGDLVGAGLQGWMRRIDAAGVVHRRPLEHVSFLASCRAVFCSDEDLGEDAARLTLALVKVVPIVVVTQGAAGAQVIVDGRSHHVPAVPVHDVVDPTGAGDVFAAAFLIALAGGADPLAAARHGAACASVVIQGPGPSALTRLPDRLK